MFVLQKGAFRFQAWRPYDYADRYNWIKHQFFNSARGTIPEELERITVKMLAGEQPTSNELMLHIVLDNLSVEFLKDSPLDESKAFYARLKQARANVSIYDDDEETLVASMTACRNDATLHSQAAYDAAHRLLKRDPMNPRLWDFIEASALPTLLNMRGNANGWPLI